VNLKVILIWGAIVGVAFVYLWRRGYLVQIRTYIEQTLEELKKCSWPTRDELKGSTVVIAISIFLLGAFTVIVDLVFQTLVRWIT